MSLKQKGNQHKRLARLRLQLKYLNSMEEKQLRQQEGQEKMLFQKAT